jgi:hypothetical protein
MQFFQFCCYAFCVLLNQLMKIVFHFISTATFEPFAPFHGPFTASHSPEFFTAPNIFLRPLLSKGAVATATWQPWIEAATLVPLVSIQADSRGAGIFHRTKQLSKIFSSPATIIRPLANDQILKLWIFMLFDITWEQHWFPRYIADVWAPANSYGEKSIKSWRVIRYSMCTNW